MPWGHERRDFLDCTHPVAAFYSDNRTSWLPGYFLPQNLTELTALGSDLTQNKVNSCFSRCKVITYMHHNLSWRHTNSMPISSKVPRKKVYLGLCKFLITWEAGVISEMVKAGKEAAEEKKKTKVTYQQLYLMLLACRGKLCQKFLYESLGRMTTIIFFLKELYRHKHS